MRGTGHLGRFSASFATPALSGCCRPGPSLKPPSMPEAAPSSAALIPTADPPASFEVLPDDPQPSGIVTPELT